MQHFAVGLPDGGRHGFVIFQLFPDDLVRGQLAELVFRRIEYEVGLPGVGYRQAYGCAHRRHRVYRDLEGSVVGLLNYLERLFDRVCSVRFVDGRHGRLPRLFFTAQLHRERYLAVGGLRVEYPFLVGSHFDRCVFQPVFDGIVYRLFVSVARYEYGFAFQLEFHGEGLRFRYLFVVAAAGASCQNQT